MNASDKIIKQCFISILKKIPIKIKTNTVQHKEEFENLLNKSLSHTKETLIKLYTGIKENHPSAMDDLLL